MSYSSYPTYEEWKPFRRAKGYMGRAAHVLILPMRNGNEIAPRYTTYHFLLRSYPTYEEWKPLSLIYKKKTSTVLILPMRNGNECGLYLLLLFLKRSYPTYEEWKPA